MGPAVQQLDQVNATLAWAQANGLPQLQSQVQSVGEQLQSVATVANSWSIPPAVATAGATAAWSLLVARCADSTGGNNDNSYYTTWNGAISDGQLRYTCENLCHLTRVASGCSAPTATTAVGPNQEWHEYANACTATTVEYSNLIEFACCCETTNTGNGCITSAVVTPPPA